MNAVLIKLNANVQVYTGVGYQYFLNKNWTTGNTAKLQCPKKLLQEFEQRKGRINSVGLPHLEIFEQGYGWWLVTSDKLENDKVVADFLARLNRWVLTHKISTAQEAKPKSARYTVTVPEIKHDHIKPIRTSEHALECIGVCLNSMRGGKLCTLNTCKNTEAQTRINFDLRVKDLAKIFNQRGSNKPQH